MTLEYNGKLKKKIIKYIGSIRLTVKLDKKKHNLYKLIKI